jgi:hypothetical protein
LQYYVYNRQDCKFFLNEEIRTDQYRHINTKDKGAFVNAWKKVINDNGNTCNSADCEIVGSEQAICRKCNQK